MAPGDPLDRYRKKRDFARSPEPAGANRSAADERQVSAGRFVVHRHEATRLHYDLRLEIDGVLRSWAVPKGFSYEPADKHLAVRTEDHPLEYLEFEGTIPLGEYGGGTMQVWDAGTWSPYRGQTADEVAAASTAERSGEIKVVLHGRRLRGEWHLVQTARGKGRDWLLFKAKDRYAADRSRGVLGGDVDLREAAETAAFPAFRPVFGGEAGDDVGERLDDPDWIAEIDFSGARAWLVKNGSEVSWKGGRFADVAARQILTDEGQRVRAADVVLDGVVFEQDGVGTCFYVFDVIRYDGLDLRDLPLRARKDVLRRVVPIGSRRVLPVDGVVARGRDLLRVVAEKGLQGIVLKRLGSPYRARAGWQRVGAGRSEELAGSGKAGGASAPRLASRVRFSNLDKVLWPVHGYTKRDLIGYYDAVAEALLPYLRDRPVHMQRFPDGVDRESFYQRQPPADPPDWMRIEEISLTGTREIQRLVVCENRDTLLYLANLASVDIHPWLSRVGTPDSPDWLVLDLDPKEAPFSHVVRIARSLGRLLRGLGLRPSLKTSGKTGLHVHVALVPGYSYEQARMFGEGVARAIVRELPDIATVERDPRARGGKVYVDYGQNRRGQTVVAPYVMRPTADATASAPLDWDELDGDLAPTRFDIRTLPSRLRERGDLFRGTLDDPQDLVEPAGRLQELIRPS